MLSYKFNKASTVGPVNQDIYKLVHLYDFNTEEIGHAIPLIALFELVLHVITPQ